MADKYLVFSINIYIYIYICFGKKFIQKSIKIILKF